MQAGSFTGRQDVICLLVRWGRWRGCPIVLMAHSYYTYHTPLGGALRARPLALGDRTELKSSYSGRCPAHKLGNRHARRHRRTLRYLNIQVVHTTCMRYLSARTERQKSLNFMRVRVIGSRVLIWVLKTVTQAVSRGTARFHRSAWTRGSDGLSVTPQRRVRCVRYERAVDPFAKFGFRPFTPGSLSSGLLRCKGARVAVEHTDRETARATPQRAN